MVAGDLLLTPERDAAVQGWLSRCWPALRFAMDERPARSARDSGSPSRSPGTGRGCRGLGGPRSTSRPPGCARTSTSCSRPVGCCTPSWPWRCPSRPAVRHRAATVAPRSSGWCSTTRTRRSPRPGATGRRARGPGRRPPRDAVRRPASRPAGARRARGQRPARRRRRPGGDGRGAVVATPLWADALATVDAVRAGGDPSLLRAWSTPTERGALARAAAHRLLLDGPTARRRTRRPPATWSTDPAAGVPLRPRPVQTRAARRRGTAYRAATGRVGTARPTRDVTWGPVGSAASAARRFLPLGRLPRLRVRRVPHRGRPHRPRVRPSYATPHSPPRTPPYPALHGAAYTPAAGPPAPSRRPSTRRATLLGLAVAAVLVLAVGAGGLAMSLARDSTSTEAGSTATGTGAKDGGPRSPAGRRRRDDPAIVGGSGRARALLDRPARRGGRRVPGGPRRQPDRVRLGVPRGGAGRCTSVQQPRRLIRSCEVGDLRIALSRWENVGAARTTTRPT